MERVEDFRYIVAGGLEYRAPHTRMWYRISGEEMLRLTPDQLRKAADAMDGKTSIAKMELGRAGHTGRDTLYI